MDDNYRTSSEPRLSSIEARLSVLENAQSPAFVERWKARTEAIRAGAWILFWGVLIVWGFVCLATTSRGCTEANNTRSRETGERCANVCEAIGMHGSALEVSDGDPGDTACFCGAGSRLVSIDRHGRVSGIDTASGVNFGDAPEP